MGGGFELALGCDLIVAAEDARFGLPEVKRGLIAAGGGVIRLPQRIPHHLAMELLLTGEPVDGRRAGELGLANRVTARGEAAAVALQLAEQVADERPARAGRRQEDRPRRRRSARARPSPCSARR